MEKKKHELVAMWAAALLLLIVGATLAEGATTATTQFVFNIATNRGHTITYGGQCTPSAFFFNEADANIDPDTDGNAMQVKPSPTRTSPNDVDILIDYNFSGATSPRDINAAYRGAIFGKPPTDNNIPSTQPNTAGYGFISADDTTNIQTNTTTLGETSSFRFVFRSNYPKEYVQDMNFQFVGAGQKAIGASPCFAAYDLNAYFWNYTISKYQQIAGISSDGSVSGDDVQTLYALATENTHGTPVQDYIGPDRNVVVLVQGMTQDVDGVACGVADYVHMEFDYFTKRPDFCQSSTLAPMTITNVGNVDLNIDGNFSSAFSGADTNLVLKVWKGTDSGCGADGNGLGGWQEPCSVTTLPPEALFLFDDGSGATFTDSSGNAHHGTTSNTAVWLTDPTQCHDGTCMYKFSGNDINVEDNITFLDLNFTISTWVYIPFGDTDPTTLISTQNGGGGNEVYLEIDPGNDLISCSAGAGITSATYDPGIEEVWTHIICTRSTDGNTSLFVNGTPFSSDTLTTGDLDLIGAGNAYLTIAPQTTSVDMRIDTTHIFAKKLISSEISTLYQYGNAQPLTWQTDEPTQTTCREYNVTNATIAARLITKLGIGDTNQMCFSGELTSRTVSGDHNKTFQTGSDFS